MGEHVAERAEFADFELAVAHRFDLGVVTGRNENLDLAAKLLADQLSDFLIDRDQASRRVVGLDAEAYRAAIWTIIRLCRRRGGATRQCQRDRTGHDPRVLRHSLLLPVALCVRQAVED
jgi:hypothetical protein